MKKVIIIVVIIILIILAIALGIVMRKDRDSEEETTRSTNVKITEFDIEGRTSLTKNGIIYIGNNTKELENNFYDIKIVSSETETYIYLNKLWYETYGKDYIQDNYLAEICRNICKSLNLENETEQFEYMLYKYIKDNYVRVRQEERIEEIQTEKLNLKFELEDNVVKLIIRGK